MGGAGVPGDLWGGDEATEDRGWDQGNDESMTRRPLPILIIDTIVVLVWITAYVVALLVAIMITFLPPG